ncbi:hypothetical protein SAMN05443270_1757 [Lacrimispora sphenoides]|jgi:hypothetical protein|uniref:hypothetical protein n=1 Tax=Lacrimispora sphenoides TaxID=29370 RepID=UPI0008ACC1B0|nr:hypothetical protein [Lacrimispora sphenoides]SET86287.1 hypothetical protein SAMN05443270_1757 [Lacrimispora sphenoides]
MIAGKFTKERMEGWRYISAKDRGLHEVISQGDTDSAMTECNWIKRLERNGQ